MTRRALQKSARVERESLAIQYDGATVVYELTLATEQRQDDALKLANDCASVDGRYLSFVRVQKSGRTSTGMPGFVIFGMVNTPETAEQLFNRMSALMAERRDMPAGEQWKAGEIRCLNPTPADAEAAWATFWDEVKGEVHRPTADGESVVVVAKGSER